MHGSEKFRIHRLPERALWFAQPPPLQGCGPVELTDMRGDLSGGTTVNDFIGSSRRTLGEGGRPSFSG